MKLFCILLLVVVYYFGSTDACDCLRIEPKNAFCQSEFVAVVKVGARHETSELAVYYDFTVEQVLRATEKGRKSLTTHRLLTNNNSAACGVYLEEGKEYVIAGYVDQEGNAHVNLCNFHGLWSTVKGDIRTGFLGGYKCSDN